MPSRPFGPCVPWGEHADGGWLRGGALRCSLYDRTARIKARNERWFGDHQPVDSAYVSAVRGRLRSGDHLVHLGAGRDSLGVIDRLQPSRGAAVSVDVDLEGLRSNTGQRRVVATGARLPFVTGSVDMILTENVFEHLEQPLAVLRECRRCLKVGGRLMFMCPNRLGYVAVVASLTPHWFHRAVKRRTMGVAYADTFPTFYKLN